MSILVLHTPAIGSHGVVAHLYAESFAALNETVAVQERGMIGHEDATAVVQVTAGPHFEPLPGVRNVAVVHHEWSRYPADWIRRLDGFDEVWVTSHHTADVLRTSGLRTAAAFVPPALDITPHASKTTWVAHQPFRFIACGEAHFRKGFHLLLEGFLQEFPVVGEAVLTVKTSTGCAWEPPRRDVTLITSRLSSPALNELYRQSDVLVSVSLGEGLGLPVAEAILVGLPVATNYWGGHQSLVTQEGFFEIPHRLVDQVFCSTPAYYAPGQQCAFSDPDAIARVLRAAVASSSDARRTMAARAREGVRAEYGQTAALARIGERVRSWGETERQRSSTTVAISQGCDA